jgi:peptidoglycan/LPS O-acetylase OafA/YrhL
MTARYRADVDGLRALAVSLVVAFHAFPTLVPAGYIGVDVFFVISGYLVTKILASDGGRSVSPLSFYVRRANRIFPALILLLVCALVAGWFLLFPHEYRALGKHVGGAAGFFTNFALFGEAGYFDARSETKPLLHLWSLAVEEQFYLVWPFVLRGIVRTGIDARRGVAVFVALSFMANIVCAVVSPVGDFYLPISRFWELAAGGLVALWHRTPDESPPKTARIDRAALGVGLVLVGALFLRRPTAYPGAWALIPVVGALMVLTADRTSPFVRRVLSHPLAVHLGLLSYPLYLWHWPLLSIGRIVAGEPLTPVAGLVLIVVALILSDLTRRFVERPFRSGRGRGDLAAATAAALVAVGLAGAWVQHARGMPDRPITRDHPLNAVGFEGAPQVTCDAGIAAKYALDLCVLPEGGRIPRMVFYGDSHAWRLFLAMKPLRAPEMLAFLGHTGPGLERADPVDLLQAERSSDRVVVVSYEPDDIADATLRERLARLIATDHRIALVVDNPTLPHDVMDCVDRPLRPARMTTACRTDLSTQEARLAPQRRIFEEIRRTAPERVTVVETIDLFCRAGGCFDRDPETGSLLYDDDAHLSFVGASRVVRRLAERLDGR